MKWSKQTVSRTNLNADESEQADTPEDAIAAISKAKCDPCLCLVLEGRQSLKRNK